MIEKDNEIIHAGDRISITISGERGVVHDLRCMPDGDTELFLIWLDVHGAAHRGWWPEEAVQKVRDNVVALRRAN